MDVRTFNQLLAQGQIEKPNMWPRLEDLKHRSIQFPFEFGLKKLPTQPGVILIRGPRQYGKSTWLDQQLKQTVQTYGQATAFYLNGDDILSEKEFHQELLELEAAFERKAPVKRIFIDEITAIENWERPLKRLFDRGHLRDVLLVTTGSKALDLRRGAEKLPGRKGKLPKNEYIFLPVSFPTFKKHCQAHFGSQTWIAYLISGGAPIAANDLYDWGRIQSYFIQLIRDWLHGEVIHSGRSRLFLRNILKTLFYFGSTPVGYAKLAREAGLANNTVASGYIEQLSDLFCVLPSWPWDPDRQILQVRKSCKFHFINLCAAIAFHPAKIRSIHEFQNTDRHTQALLIEWLVTQEIWRRAVLRDAENPEAIGFWKSKSHEIDLVTPFEELIEVKAGQANSLEFAWFPKTFSKKHLKVICSTPFESKRIKGITLEDFLEGSVHRKKKH